MLNAYAKNKDNSVIFLNTTAKNVFDQNGVSLESHLDNIYAELGKRDIKRLYREISEITEATTPSTFEIISAMEDNTIALLSIENDSHLVRELDSRLGGVMILVKKTSVYFSSGVFFTYRYGDVITGSSGVGGTSFEWHKNTKTIHSYHSGESTILGGVGSYQKITQWGGQGRNARLTQTDGSITIPNGVHSIMISAYVVLESVADGDKFMQIFKNNVESKIMVKSHIINNGTLCITPLILEVTEGDVIDLRVYSNSLDTLRSKHLTIEVID